MCVGAKCMPVWALWQLGDSHKGEVCVCVVTSQRSCSDRYLRVVGGARSFMGLMVVWLQALPAAERITALGLAAGGLSRASLMCCSSDKLACNHVRAVC